MPYNPNEPWQGRVHDNGSSMPPRSTKPAAIDRRRFGGRDEDPLSRLTSRLRNGNGRDQAPPAGTTPMSSPASFSAGTSSGFDQGEMDPSDLGPEDLMQLVRICLGGLRGPDRHQFLLSLAELISAPGMDRAPRSGRRMGADRRLAQDEAVAAVNARGFAQRWPEARHIRFSANGRY